MSFQGNLAAKEPSGARLMEDMRYEAKNELSGRDFSDRNVPADSTSQNFEILKLSTIGCMAVWNICKSPVFSDDGRGPDSR